MLRSDLEALIEQEGNFDTWDYQGFTCYIRRHDTLKHWCGYVEVYNINCYFDNSGDVPDIIQNNIHGGITMSCIHTNLIEGKEIHVLGFDCAHSNDIIPGLLKESPTIETYMLLENTYRTKLWTKCQCTQLVDNIIQYQDEILRTRNE